MTSDATNTNGTDDKAPIPYARFQQINSKLRAALAEIETLRAGKTNATLPKGDTTGGAPATTPNLAVPVAINEVEDLRAKLAAAEQRASDLERSQLQRAAAAAAGLPESMAARIMGATAAEMQADAEALKAGLPTPDAPKLDASTPPATKPEGISNRDLFDPAYYNANREAIWRDLKAGRLGSGLPSIPNGYGAHRATFGN